MKIHCDWRRRVADWREETHSTGFELRRHFFSRFFDSDLVSTPGQWRVVAIGAFGIVISLSLVMTQAYYGKYRRLLDLDTSGPFQMAAIADHLFLITLSMFLIALLTTLQWPSLFPGLRDYLALTSLPLRMRDVFVAKFSALFAFGSVFIVGCNLLPSIILPGVMGGRYFTNAVLNIVSIFISTTLAALFVFFALVALQGLLLNLLPARIFPRVSLVAQGALLIAILCGLPFVFSIPNLQSHMNQRPDWVRNLPPFWFLGLDQAILGNRELFVLSLARSGWVATLAAALAAVGTYAWSYRRHKVRLLETPSRSQQDRVMRDRWSDAAGEWIMPDPRARAVFSFIGKTLSRSRSHRMVLTVFAGLAIALIFESFVTLALGRGFRGFGVRTFALRQAVTSAPLALSLFVLAGYRYLFRLPVELGANWVFRISESGNREVFLQAVWKFLLLWGVAPVAFLTLPFELQMLGPTQGLIAAGLCLIPSLVLMEFLLLQSQRIPFTSSYLPGQHPLIQTFLIYGISVGLYVSALSAIIAASLDGVRVTLILAGLMLAAWLRIRKARREDWKVVGKLEFEEVAEPAVMRLCIERD
ncbi:MAG: hypothetical protein M3Y27_00705 [Acidobacteriota bacterium]|nr:hypothetical protein [Acidobacteriota bacterium]